MTGRRIRASAAGCIFICAAFFTISCTTEFSTPTARPGGRASSASRLKLSDEPPSMPPPVAHAQSFRLASGTLIPIKLMTVLDTLEPYRGFVMGAVADDVKGADGRLAIPKNSQAAIVIRQSDKINGISVLRLGLYSINVDGQQWVLSNGAKETADITFSDDAARGFSHGVVHLPYGTLVQFRLKTAARLR